MIPGGSDDDAVVLIVVASSWPYCPCSCVVCEPSITTSGSSSEASEENFGGAADAEGLVLSLLSWAMSLVGEELSGYG